MTALTYAEACDAHAEAQGLLEPFQKLRTLFPPGTVHLDQTGGFTMLIRVHQVNQPFPYVWISAEISIDEDEFCCGLYQSDEEDSTEEYVFSSKAALPEVCLHLLQKDPK